MQTPRQDSDGAPLRPLDPRAVTFGVRLANSGPLAGVDAIEAVAGLASGCGFSTLWVHDHIPWASEMLTHFSSGSIEACEDQDPNFFESVSTAVYVAGLFEGLHVGIAGLVLPLRDPRVLAKQLFMTAQVLTRGRMITALAVGNIPNDFEVMGVPFGRRGRITDEFLGAIDAIYGHRRSTFQGELVQFEDAEFFPKPERRDFWIAGNSPPAYRRIASSASGWLPAFLDPAGYAEGLGHITEALAGAGRSTADVHRGVELFIGLAETDRDAHQLTDAFLEHRFGDLERGRSRSVVGSGASVVEQLQAYCAAGVSHFELRFICHSLEAHLDAMKHFAGDVLPHLPTTSVV